MAGKRSKSSDRWLRRQKKDYFTRQAREQGQVSRAHFKLAEMNDKFRLISRSSLILELGAAPGGWTNYIESKLSNRGGLVVVDPRPITCGADTVVVAGLAGEPETDELIQAAIGQMERRKLLSQDKDKGQGQSKDKGGDAIVSSNVTSTVNSRAERCLDLVLSDMAPNISGVRAVDQARAMELADVTLIACRQWLQPGGSMALKAFQGEGLDEWVRERRQAFKKVVMTKPKSSRSESREVFVVCQSYNPAHDELDSLV